MNFKHAHRIAEFFTAVAQLDNKKAVAVFHLNELTRTFDFSKSLYKTYLNF